MNKTMLGAAIALALGVAMAPISSADASHPDGNKYTPGTTVGKYDGVLWPAGTGGNSMRILMDENCNPVKGTWVEGKGFVVDPNGKDVAWVDMNTGEIKSSPFDDGLSDSSRDMLKRVNAAKAAKKKAAEEAASNAAVASDPEPASSEPAGE